jgi:hypothetical protein
MEPREYLAVFQEANRSGRKPLLLLVLSDAPPVRVKGHATVEPTVAIAKWLEPVLARCDYQFPSTDTLLTQVTSVVAYTTWTTLHQQIAFARDAFTATGNSSVDAAIGRLVSAALTTIQWHGQWEQTDLNCIEA